MELSAKLPNPETCAFRERVVRLWRDIDAQKTCTLEAMNANQHSGPQDGEAVSALARRHGELRCLARDVKQMLPGLRCTEAMYHLLRRAENDFSGMHIAHPIPHCSNTALCLPRSW